MSSETRLSQLEARLEKLAQQNQQLESELATLKAGGTDPGPGTDASTAVATLERPVDSEVVEVDDTGAAIIDRRKALRNLGGLAAASAAIFAGTSALRPAPAAAEAFTSLIIGEEQGGAQHSTRLFATPGGGTTDPYGSATFAARNTGAGSSGSRVGLYGGASNQGTGVYGEGLGGDSSYPSYGVRGTTDAAQGNFLIDFPGAGVYGQATGAAGIGVRGRTNGGTGVYAEGGDTSTHAVGLRAQARGGAPIVVMNSSIAVPPDQFNWERGSLVHKDGELWFCIQGGSAANSRWTPLSANNLVTLEVAARVYDSRPGQAPSAGVQSPIGFSDLRIVDVTETGNVPETAKGILANVTVDPTNNRDGFLTLWKEGEPQPGSSNVNFNGSIPVPFANNATVALNAGKLSATVGGNSGASIDLIIDVAGYYL